MSNFLVAAFYKFSPLTQLAARKSALVDLSSRLNVGGTVILANEGLNGTIAARPADVRDWFSELKNSGNWPGFEDLDRLAKYSSSSSIRPFRRFKCNLRKEIVTFGVADIDLANVGEYVDPMKWNELMQQRDASSSLAVIDCRNDFEVHVGSFKNAINPQTVQFRDFPQWFNSNKQLFYDTQTNKPKTILTFCTGGIRCEKATAFIKQQGFADVRHLKGGIINYLQSVPKNESLFDGECFVFDHRVAITHTSERADNVSKLPKCYGCRRPLLPEDMLEHYVAGVQCKYCHDKLTEKQKKKFKDRHEQYAVYAKRSNKIKTS